jgi:uroporphyrinogen-III synthase
MLVLVTRPREQAIRTARDLAAMGHEAILDPVLEIRSLPLARLDLAGVAAVAITSANAAHALAAVPAGLPVFAVGGATAAAARVPEARVAAGDGRALAGLIARTLGPGAGTVLHLSGAEVSDGLAEGLAAAGLACRRVVVYEALPTGRPAPETEAALREGRLGAVLLYSPRSARLWAEAMGCADLAGRLAAVTAVCLSQAVAAELRGLPLREVRVAAKPDQDALLRCLEATR